MNKNKMKIAFIMNSFPTISETFILNQITGLIDKGHEVYIFANENKNQSKIHDDEKNIIKYKFYTEKLSLSHFF
jgi:colanic acid/amylovoran biosynthesis glycosyltransferase